MNWFAVIAGAQCLVLGWMGWSLYGKRESTILRAVNAGKPKQDKSLDSAKVCNLLATAGKALSDHSEHLDNFERSLQAADEGRPDFSALGEIQHANGCVEHAIDTTIAGLIAACGDLLNEEQSGLEAYREHGSALGSTLDGIKNEELLVQFASTLLSMVRELRVENKVMQNELVASKDKIIQLLTRASSAEQIARVDTLTQLPNRRAFDEVLAHCKELQDQSGQPYSLIMLDIDHFKSVNDKYGHTAGDAVLSMLARVLRENTKTSDHACRLGGEEFAVLLPRCEESVAKAVAERYRKTIESLVLRHGEYQIAITVSCGVAQAIPGKSQSHLLDRADAALYTAKTRGRNQTCADGNLKGNLQDLAIVK